MPDTTDHRLRATWRHPRAAHYRRPGGPWTVAPLDTALALPPSLADERTELSRGEMAARIDAVAASLRARKVRRGDVVAWQLPNVIEAFALYRACWRIGAVAAPLHHLASAIEVERMLAAIGGARVVITDRDEVATMPAAGAVPPAPVRPSDLAVVLFTSGSTGAPKAVLHTHRGLAWKAALMARVHGLGGGDAVLMPAPLAHISGLLNAVLVPGAAAMAVTLMPKWDPDHALALIEDRRVSFMIGPPTFFVGLMHTAAFTTQRVATLRLISSGGAGVSPAFVTEASDRFGCVVKRTYGSTEAPTVTTSFAGDPLERARTTDGRPVGDVELRLGAGGELLLRGPELFAGYADAAQTRAALTRGWFRTGDVGQIDRNGWLTITGRIKDFIIRGGENIAAAEVEAVLEAHPAVRQAVAVGEPDERLGERVVAFVVAGAPFDLATCRDWFALQGVARFKTPERIITVDALPTLAAGKPDRAALQARLVAPEPV